LNLTVVYELDYFPKVLLEGLFLNWKLASHKIIAGLVDETGLAEYRSDGTKPSGKPEQSGLLQDTLFPFL
jgi:hypothetical protein